VDDVRDNTARRLLLDTDLDAGEIAILLGFDEPSSFRDSMEFSIVAKSNGEWCCEGLMNARQLTMERQFALDELDKPAAY
jgi:AraC-like DNA-binding protein